MNKYQRLYNQENKERDYTRFEDSIVKNHLSSVLYKNKLLAGFLDLCEPIFNLLVNTVKKIKTMNMPYIDSNYKNFN